MKKYVICAVVLTLMCLLVACGSDNKSSAPKTDAPATVAPDTTAPATDATAAPTEEPVATNTPTPVPTLGPLVPVTEEGDNALNVHGKLSVVDGKLVDKNGDPFQLKGVSTHGIHSYARFVNYDAFKELRDNWGANIVRICNYVEKDNYLGNRERYDKIIDEGIEYCTSLGMYVMIDWHVLKTGDPNVYVDEAITHFNNMSLKYQNYDNVIYEICNEPNGEKVDWEAVKNYANQVIPVIRANDPDGIILVGSPTWSQDIHLALADPLEYDNIMYTFHFYAGSHMDDLRQRVIDCTKAGLPVFISEFGCTDNSGTKFYDFDNADKWMDTLNEYNLSYCCWNFTNKFEKCSLLNVTCTKTSGFEWEDLSEHGQWLVKKMGGKLAE